MTALDQQFQTELSTSTGGAKGRTVELPQGSQNCDATLSLGNPNPILSIQGKGIEQSGIVANRDFGEGAYVIGSAGLKGARSHYRDFGIDVDHGIGAAAPGGLPRRTDGTEIHMVGLRVPGGGTVVDSVKVGHCSVGLDFCSDHTKMHNVRAFSNQYGVRFGDDQRQEASHEWRNNDLTDNFRASVCVSPTNVMGGILSDADHLGFSPIGIEKLPPAWVGNMEPNDKAVSGLNCRMLMVEAIGNYFIYAPGSKVIGNKFESIDIAQIWNTSRLIPGMAFAWILCSDFSDNYMGDAQWLSYPSPGSDAFIQATSARNNYLEIPRLPDLKVDATGKAKQIIGAPADHPNPGSLTFELAINERMTGRRGKLVKLYEGDIKKNELMGAKLSNYRMRRHPGDSSPVYGTAGQDGKAGDWIVLWERPTGVTDIATDDVTLDNGNDFLLGVSPSSPGKAVKVTDINNCIAISTSGRNGSRGSIPARWA